MERKPSTSRLDENWGRWTPWKFNIATESIPSQKERLVFQPSFFSGYVKLREGSFLMFFGFSASSGAARTFFGKDPREVQCLQWVSITFAGGCYIWPLKTKLAKFLFLQEIPKKEENCSVIMRSIPFVYEGVYILYMHMYIFMYIYIGSMFGIFTYIYHRNYLHVGKCTIIT